MANADLFTYVADVFSHGFEDGFTFFKYGFFAGGNQGEGEQLLLVSRQVEHFELVVVVSKLTRTPEKKYAFIICNAFFDQ